MKGNIIFLDYQQAVDFLLPKHYSGRKPNISKAFGWHINGELKAVCTFGKPASNTLCDGICGKELSSQVYELNRLCRTDDLKEQLSQFVSACLRRLRTENWIVVSYSDMGMNHNGYIYQACNFIYTGLTKERLEFYVPNGHSRHGSKDSNKRKIRTAKHRYVFFCSFNNKVIKKYKSALNYAIMPYPKAENQNYVLGEYIKPIIVQYGSSS